MLKNWATALGMNQSVKLLDATLEEKKTDETLTELAQSGVNQHAQAVRKGAPLKACVQTSVHAGGIASAFFVNVVARFALLTAHG
jgi:Domain of unknown function (DUF892)